jgi:4-carboxymuconolactone decarboxylase
MRIALIASLFATIAAGQSSAQGQKLPADIDPQSFSRLPLIQREKLSGEALRVYDAVVGKDANGKDRSTPPLGPQATSLYSLGVALPMNQLNQYLRNPVVGTAMYQICTLIAAREFDEPYEWNSHEAGARRANVDPKTIEAIKFNRSLDGLPEKDALVVRFGRAIFQDRKVSPEPYAKVVETFGQQGMFELTAVMGDYAMAAIMLRAVDQHVPNATSELPAIKR